MKIYQKVSNKWTKWFAWYPVEKQNGKVVWLEIVYRKLEHARISNVFPSSWTIYK